MAVTNIDELRKIRDKVGFQVCLDSVSPNDIKGILICEGINPEYYAIQAHAFEKEMEKRTPAEDYLIEKFMRMADLFRVVHRFGDMPNRHGTEKTKEFWEDISQRLYDYYHDRL